jgi:hypothetical protein
MVKTVVRGLTLLYLMLPLASCIFFFSAFPPTLTQVVARTDLSSVIPAGSAGDFQVYCVSATAAPPGEFVLLMNKNASVDPRVIILDSNLNLIQTYTTSQLDGWAGGPGNFSGSSIMSDAGGNIEIGNLGFSATELQNIAWNPSWINTPVMGPSYCSPFKQSNDINFHVTGGNGLNYSQFHPWWSFDFNSIPLPIKGTPDTQFQVEGVYNIDDSPGGGKVILVLGEQSNPTVHFVAIPRAHLHSHGGPVVLTPIFDNYPHASYSNVESSSVGFAGDCLVAYSYQDHAMVRYSLTPPFSVISSLPVGQSVHQITYGYKADGSYSVQLDQSTSILTKVARWW